MKKSAIICTAKIIISLLLLCLFSGNNSPFAYGCYSYDVSYYNVVGRMINAGRIPYIDFYDIKGPVFLYWQALGQRISETRWGMFILECLLMCISVLFIHLIGELCGLRELYGFILLGVYQYVFIKVFWGTCSVEEFTLPFNLFALHCAVDQMNNRFEKRCAFDLRWRLVLLGIMFSLAVFSKVTTVAPLCICVAYIVCLIFREESKKSALVILMHFALGFFAVTAVIIGYSVQVGNLSDMLTWVFQKAVSRGINKGMDVDAGMIVRSFLIVFIIVYALIKIHRKTARRIVWLLLTVSLSAFVILQIGDRWSYYYLQLLPMLVLFMVVFFEDVANIKHRMTTVDENKRRLWMGDYLLGLFCFILILAMFRGDVSPNAYNGFKCVTGNANNEEEKIFNDITLRISQDDRSGIFCCEKAICYFDSTGILPANRCPGFASTLGFLDDNVKNSRCEELKQCKPLWVIGRNTAEYEQELVLEVLNSDYSIIYNDDLGYELWKRKK